jgi:broad-specificity NMP kinase
MDDFFKEKAGGIVIFRGDPGTGKSTYCKHLIAKYKRDVDFVIAPQDVILSNPEGFRNYLLNSSDYYIESNDEKMKPQVFIIEDCEKLLIDRDSLSGNNTSIILSDILNYSDGIVGDLVQSKFIFTFNTNLSKIDKALLRKGRMKLNYEFTTLKGDDLKNLMEKKNLPYTEENLKKGLSLAEIYNLEEKDYQREEKRKIGF